jgi:propanol-preferring alcohol dehydrogenase
MKAMILKQPKSVDKNPLEWVDVPKPTPKEDEILIHVNVCGVCHTDLHTVEGELDLKKKPIIPGHQVVGTVEEKGDHVEEFELGDRVGVTWLYSACGDCEFCNSGRENLCDDAQFTGLHHDGGYAEYMVIPAHYALKMPEGFGDLQAAPLLCAGVIGYRSLRLSDIKPRQTLGLYGFGASAHITIQVARYWDCDVYVFTRSEEHRQHARELGAVWTGSAKDDPPVSMDSSITFAPVGWIIPEALRVLKKGGTLAINAVHLSPIPKLKYELIYHERTLRSVANCTHQDGEEFIKLAAEIPIKTDIDVHKLKEANAVLQRLKRSEINGAAVLEIKR